MPISISLLVVQVVGLSLCLFAMWGIFSPTKLLQWMQDMMNTDWGIYVAVVVRLALGAALIVAAPDSRFPGIFLIVGWIAIAAAVVGLLIGKHRLRRFVAWWVDRFTPTSVRLWLLIALLFGGFLIYGAT